jgi:hypothetical protein
MEHTQIKYWGQLSELHTIESGASAVKLNGTLADGRSTGEK